MADLQIGNAVGVVAIGPAGNVAAICNVTADGGVNIATVAAADVFKLRLGMTVDIKTRATGAVVAAARTITGLTTAGAVTYSGADAATTAAEGIYPSSLGGTNVVTDAKTNVNGGPTAREGFTDAGFDTIEGLRQRLKTLDAAYFTDTRMNTMSENDLLYALRVRAYSASIK